MVQVPISISYQEYRLINFDSKSGRKLIRTGFKYYSF